MNVAPTRASGALIQRRWMTAAAPISVHITIRQVSPYGPGMARRKAGVAVPAMRKKIIMWSIRCRRTDHGGLHEPR